MDNDRLRNEIITDILGAYRDLTNPDFSWVIQKYQSQPYKKNIISMIEHGFSVDEETDLNEDVSVNLYVQKDEEHYVLKLSLVGKYAVLFRADLQGIYHILSYEDIESSHALRLLTKNFARDEITFLDASIIELPIGLHLFNTEIEDTTFYNALFADEIAPGRIP
ncbi:MULTISPECIES: hypothetical protein [Acidiphilium]|nr:MULTISPECIES: hypothetical protein [Acidiphilium]